METHARASDGRRRFTAEFKREQMSRVSRGEVTLAELSREIDVSPSVVRRWKHLVERGSQAAVAANEEVESWRFDLRFLVLQFGLREAKHRSEGSIFWPARSTSTAF